MLRLSYLLIFYVSTSRERWQNNGLIGNNDHYKNKNQPTKKQYTKTTALPQNQPKPNPLPLISDPSPTSNQPQTKTKTKTQTQPKTPFPNSKTHSTCREGVIGYHYCAPQLPFYCSSLFLLKSQTPWSFPCGVPTFLKTNLRGPIVSIVAPCSR